MAEQLIDGIGSGYLAQVDNTHRLMVRTEGITVGSISLGSVSIAAGSESYIKNWNEMGSTVVVDNLYAGSKVWPGATFEVSGTIVGSIVSMPSVSVSTGSESYIKGGSISVYNRVAGSIVDFPGYLGSKVYQGDRFGVSGTIDISNRVGGSIVNWPGSLAISNFNALGSNVVVTNLYAGSKAYQGERFGISGTVDVSNRVAGSIVNLPDVTISNPSTIGSYTLQEIVGSVAVTSPINVTTGSEMYIKGGSVEVFTGSIHVNNFSAGTGYAGSDVWQGTDPWIVLGSVAVTSPINVSVGSESWIKNTVEVSGAVFQDIAGSVAITSPISVSVGSETWVQNVVEVSGAKLDNLAGSFAISNFNAIGSSVVVTNFGDLGSSVVVKDILSPTGSIEVFQTTNADLQVQATQEGIWTVGTTLGSTTIYNLVGGSIVNWPGSLAISNFNALGSTVIISNFDTLGSSVVVTNLGSEVYIKGGSVEVTTGSIYVTNFSAGTGYAGSDVYQGTTPWEISGNVQFTGIGSTTLLSAVLDVSSGTSVQVIAGTADKNINVYAYKAVATAASLFKWQNSGTDLEGPQNFAANGGVAESVTPPAYLFRAGTGSELRASLSAGSIGGRVSYFLT